MLERATRENKPVEESNIASSNALLDAILAVKPEGDRELDLYPQALDLTAIGLDAGRSAKGNTAGALWGLFRAELSSCLLSTAIRHPCLGCVGSAAAGASTGRTGSGYETDQL